MKKLLLSTAVVAVLAFSASAAQAQITNVAVGTADAEVAAPVTVSQATGLDFGIFAINADATDWTVGSGSTTVTSANVQQLSTSIEDASFNVSGEAGASYTFAMLDGTAGTGLADEVTLTEDGPGTATLVASLTATGVTNLTGGIDVVTVAGEIGSTGQTASGSYYGEYQVTVTYP